MNAAKPFLMLVVALSGLGLLTNKEAPRGEATAEQAVRRWIDAALHGGPKEFAQVMDDPFHDLMTQFGDKADAIDVAHAKLADAMIARFGPSTAEAARHMFPKDQSLRAMPYVMLGAEGWRTMFARTAGVEIVDAKADGDGRVIFTLRETLKSTGKAAPPAHDMKLTAVRHGDGADARWLVRPVEAEAVDAMREKLATQDKLLAAYDRITRDVTSGAVANVPAAELALRTSLGGPATQPSLDDEIHAQIDRERARAREEIKRDDDVSKALESARKELEDQLKVIERSTRDAEVEMPRDPKAPVGDVRVSVDEYAPPATAPTTRPAR